MNHAGAPFLYETAMKFLPPEEEIRAQLRELTSKTRRLRADLQGLIDDKGRSDSVFARQRLRVKEDERPTPSDGPDPPARRQYSTVDPPKSKPPKSPKRR
jgi:hypothetical protein